MCKARFGTWGAQGLGLKLPKGFQWQLEWNPNDSHNIRGLMSFDLCLLPWPHLPFSTSLLCSWHSALFKTHWAFFYPRAFAYALPLPRMPLLQISVWTTPYPSVTTQISRPQWGFPCHLTSRNHHLCPNILFVFLHPTHHHVKSPYLLFVHLLIIFGHAPPHFNNITSQIKVGTSLLILSTTLSSVPRRVPGS